jgi:heme-degrading monooxygenase HmoA
MYLQTVRLAGDPEDLEVAIREFDRESMPIRRLPGCAAVALMVHRNSGKGVIFSYWETEPDLRASEEAAADAREVMTSEHDLEAVDVERYEVAILERHQPLKEGTCARIICSRGEPGHVNRLGHGMRDHTLPLIKRHKGFRSVVAAFNRKNGRVVAGSCWETAADRDASEPALASMRLEVMQAVGARQSITVENLEVVFADIRVAAGAA